MKKLSSLLLISTCFFFPKNIQSTYRFPCRFIYQTTKGKFKLDITIDENTTKKQLLNTIVGNRKINKVFLLDKSRRVLDILEPDSDMRFDLSCFLKCEVEEGRWICYIDVFFESQKTKVCNPTITNKQDEITCPSRFKKKKLVEGHNKPKPITVLSKTDDSPPDNTHRKHGVKQEEEKGTPGSNEARPGILLVVLIGVIVTIATLKKNYTKKENNQVKKQAKS